MVSGVVLVGVFEAMSRVLSCCWWIGADADGSDTAAQTVPPAVRSKAAEMASSFFMGWRCVWIVQNGVAAPSRQHTYLPANEYISDARDIDLRAAVAVMVPMTVAMMPMTPVTVTMTMVIMPAMTATMIMASMAAVTVIVIATSVAMTVPVSMTVAVIPCCCTRRGEGQGSCRDKRGNQKFHKGVVM
jgi:hypothetical protein